MKVKPCSVDDVDTWIAATSNMKLLAHILINLSCRIKHVAYLERKGP